MTTDAQSITPPQLRLRLRSGSATIGGWSTVGDPQVMEAMATTGVFDWIVVDLEHAAFSEDQAATLFCICERCGVAPLARLSGHDPRQGRKMLDLGAHGLVIPMIESVQQFLDLTRHFFYPPKGSRGSGLSRANVWGDRFIPYNSGFEPVLVPMIESRQGIERVAEIASLPTVDALFLGPYDLSGAFGKPGNFETNEYRAAIAQAKRAATDCSKPMGIHVVEPVLEKLEQAVQDGFRFLAYGTDVICMRSALKPLAKLARG